MWFSQQGWAGMIHKMNVTQSWADGAHWVSEFGEIAPLGYICGPHSVSIKVPGVTGLVKKPRAYGYCGSWVCSFEKTRHLDLSVYFNICITHPIRKWFLRVHVQCMCIHLFVNCMLIVLVYNFM